MNERILELMKQAGLSYLYDYDTDGHAMVCNEMIFNGSPS